LLAATAITQTRLDGWQLPVVVALFFVALAHAWWRLSQAGLLRGETLLLSLRPLKLELQTADGLQHAYRCVSLSVYRWLIVMQFQPVNPAAAAVPTVKRRLVLLPDSLSGARHEDWRLLLIWARQMRRQISSGKGSK